MKSIGIKIVPFLSVNYLYGACEQHGQHLPLAVDTIDCYEIAKRVSTKEKYQ
jgi:hypothetical protein